ncbi:hypothetical protein C6496_21470 [Candidatus Poribacteria bacterium]|nr:MAG: hypothetical protein C6496_21470 [Candidatus Poribacteria bacterium]
MRRHWVLLLLLVFASIMGASSASGGMFMDSGLVDIPTGAVLEHGVFAIGPYVAARLDQREVSSDHIAEYLVATTCFHLNFGLFDRVEVGLGYVWNEDGWGEQRGELSTEQAASLKVQLLKEQEVGAVPSIAIGIEYLGDGILTTDSVADNSSPSPFLSVSKTFNLPRIHQFSGHIGVGANRFQFEEGPLGLFVGLSKEFQPAFARGDITMSLEFDGADVNAGMQYITASGLQIALGAETLNNPDALRYLVAISWTNKPLLEQIDETHRLIQRATQLAIEAKRAASEKKSDK